MENETVTAEDNEAFAMSEMSFTTFTYIPTSDVPGGLRYEEWDGDRNVLVRAKEIRQQNPNRGYINQEKLATSDAAKEVLVEKCDDIDRADNIDIV